MKELSIEEKAKRYDESLERAKKLKETCDSTAVVGWCEYIFNELRESEDEKIRREIVRFIQMEVEDEILGNKWLAWLEKRNKENMIEALRMEYEKGKGDVLQEQRKEWTAEDLLNRNEIIDILQEYNRDDLITWFEKQGKSKFESCVQDGDNIVTNEDGTHFNVSQLERVSQKVTDTKEAAKKFLKTAGIMDKNGEQLAEEYMQGKSSKFHIGDTVKIHCCERPKYIQDIYNNKVGNIDCIWDLNENPWGNIGVILENGFNNLFFESELEIVAKTEKIMDGNDTDEKIVEVVKDTSVIDMVEPKFKAGDWVVDSQGLTHQIERVVENVTTHTFGYDIVGGGYFNDDNEGVHLWTIQDAKDGDVLVTVNGKRPFIYKGCLDPNHPDSPVAYYGIDTEGYFCSGGGHFDHWWTDSKVQPATKEQRDLLFSKMKEYGFEWDTDKKESRKIEQSKLTAFEEEVKDMINDYRDAIDSNNATIEEVKERAAYLLSLIPQKSVWSEEDDKMLIDAIGAVGAADYYTYDDKQEIENWLKSLKERLHPQWKPSEEQIQALEYQVHSTYKGSWQYKASKELLEQIKKL